MISRLAVTLCNRVPASKGTGCLLSTSWKTRNTLTGSTIWRSVRQNASNSPNAEKVKPSLWNKVFGKYLLTTNTISSGILMVIGDWVAQEIEFRRHGSKEENAVRCIDYKRMWRMFVVGALMGPMHHYVYIWMDRVMPVATVRNTLQKILIDQVVMSPACILLFFYSACFLEKKSIAETNDELVSKFPYIYLMDWIFWPGAQYVNFHYLDIKYRVTFVNVCTAIYNIFLSYMKHDFDLDV